MYLIHLCLITVVLVGVSYQRIPVLSAIRYSPSDGTVSPKAYADHVKRQQDVTVKDEGPPVIERIVHLQQCPKCTCGTLGREGKIIGGSFTYVNKYPWMAMIKTNDVFTCGASLINDKYVLTAAHCVEKSDPKTLIVRLLEHDRYDNTETKHMDFSVLEVIKHENYNDIKHDIALLRLDTEGVEFGPKTGINPVCLPPEGKSFVGFKGVVTGWGIRKVGGRLWEKLRELYVPILSNEKCKRIYHKTEKSIWNNVMCAGYMASNGEGISSGDSGGPLQIKINSAYHQVGVVSWTGLSNKTSFPGVFTRVNRYLNWVAENTADACSCSDPYAPLENDA